MNSEVKGNLESLHILTECLRTVNLLFLKKKKILDPDLSEFQRNIWKWRRKVYLTGFVL